MVSNTTSAGAVAVSVRRSWRVLGTALRGNALGAFPNEAFEEEIVIHRVFGRSQFILNRPDAIRHVLVENGGNYLRSPPTIRVLRPIFGQGLFLSSGEQWRHQRRIAASAFTPRAIRILARHVAAAAEALVTDLRARGDGPIQLVPLLRRLALEIIGSAMFSLEMKKYGKPMRELILRYAARLGRPTLLDFLLPLEVPTPRDLARRRFRRHWIALIQQIVAERRCRRSHGSGRDLFDLLAVENPDGSEPDFEQLADQVATIVVAGHETTAAGLFWCLYLLAGAPKEQDLIAEEAEAVDLDPERAADALPRLIHTRATVDEVLRLYPPAFVIAKRSKTTL